LSIQGRALMTRLARASHAGLISVSVAAEAIGASRRATAVRLAKLVRGGWLQRAHRGLYLIVPLEAKPGHRATVEDPWVLAKEVFAPCYIGGWSAAEHWDLTEQLFRSTLVVTAASVRSTQAAVLGNEFRVFRVPRTRLSAGVVSVWRGAEQVPVSGIERTLIDGLRTPALAGGVRHFAQMLKAYGERTDHDFEKLFSVAREAASGAAWKRLGYLIEVLWPERSDLLTRAHAHLTAGNARLDPTVRRKGHLLKRWRLLVNVDLAEFSSKRPV
jgi:predicted transcriptional regulator of viral defense system